MPNPPSLLHIVAKKIADNLDVATFSGLNFELKEEVLKQLSPEKLLEFCRRHADENADLRDLGPEILLDTLFKCNDERFLKNVLDYFFQNINLCEKKVHLALFHFTHLSYYCSDQLDTSEAIKMLALAVKIKLMQIYSYDKEEYDFKLTLQQLGLLGEVIDGPLKKFAEFLLEKLSGCSPPLILDQFLGELQYASYHIGVCALIFPQLDKSQRKVVFDFLIAGLELADELVLSQEILACASVFMHLEDIQRDEVFKKLLTKLHDAKGLIIPIAFNTAVIVFVHLNASQREELLFHLMSFFHREEIFLYSEIVQSYAEIFPYLNSGQCHRMGLRILALLQSESWEVRKTAIKNCVGIFSFLDSVQRNAMLAQLSASLTDSEWIVRKAAVETYAALFPRLDIAERHVMLTQLFAMLRNSELLLSIAAMHACAAVFTHLDETMRERVISEILASLHGIMRCAALDAYTAVFLHLDTTQRENMLRQLFRLFQTNDRQVRKGAIEAGRVIFPHLENSQRKRLLPQLFSGSQDSDFFVRSAAIQCQLSIFRYLELSEQQQVLPLLVDRMYQASKIIPFFNQGHCLQLGAMLPSTDGQLTRLSEAVLAAQEGIGSYFNAQGPGFFKLAQGKRKEVDTQMLSPSKRHYGSPSSTE